MRVDSEMTCEPPKDINANNVQHWSRHTKELKQSQVSKALKFVRHDCIQYLGKAFETMPELAGMKSDYAQAKHIFVCLPLNTATEFEFFGRVLTKVAFGKDYNSSEYMIFKHKDGTFECNCQAWQTKAHKGEIVNEGANCSHILALYYCFKMRKFNNEHGAEERHMKPDVE